MKNVLRNLYGCLLLVTLLGTGCWTAEPPAKQAQNPLAGWRTVRYGQPSLAIEKDYQEYIENLPTREKMAAAVSRYLENDSGQHAILVEVALRGTWWYHILVYAHDDRRINVIKYSQGHYQS
jgi:hypothetical protein